MCVCMYVCWLSDENPSNVQEAGGIHGSSIINRCRKSILLIADNEKRIIGLVTSDVHRSLLKVGFRVKGSKMVSDLKKILPIDKKQLEFTGTQQLAVVGREINVAVTTKGLGQ